MESLDWRSLRNKSGKKVSLSDLVSIKEIDSDSSFRSKFPKLAIVLTRKGVSPLGDDVVAALKSQIEGSFFALNYKPKGDIFTAQGRYGAFKIYTPVHKDSALYGDEGVYEASVQIQPEYLANLGMAKNDYTLLKVILSEKLKTVKF